MIEGRFAVFFDGDSAPTAVFEREYEAMGHPGPKKGAARLVTYVSKTPREFVM